ncbi:MAG: arsenate reductase ArsC [Gammaproteobacteria bacterium]|nr:arsenate reductase ArsC [Gammaproteobacteria bacterium]
MKKVLFVCIENSCRSQLAEAFARIHAENVWQVYSSGSNPSGVVNYKAITAMEELGYDMSTHCSKSLEQIPDVVYDVVITMGCGDRCPSVRAIKREDWNIPDPKHMDETAFREVRDHIEKQVLGLLDRMTT